MKPLLLSSPLLALILVGCGQLGLEAMNAVAEGGPFDPDSGPDPVDTDDPWEADADADADADSDSDADADADADSDADTDPVELSAPLLLSFGLSEAGSSGTFEGVFEGDDPDSDLYGGTALVSLGGISQMLSIPGDLDSFVTGGESSFTVASSSLLPGETVSASLILEDATGLQSGQRSDSVTLAGFNHSLSEPDDDFGTAYDVGLVGMPGYLAGALSQASNDGAAYTGDMDFIAFRVSSRQTVTFSLSWSMSAGDYDLRLGELNRWLETAIYDGTRQPEEITYTLETGTTYYLAVAGWSGPAGDYEVEIQ